MPLILAFRRLRKPEEDVRSPEAELQVVVSHLIWVLGMNLGPLGEEQVLSAAELSLQPCPTLPQMRKLSSVVHLVRGRSKSQKLCPGILASSGSPSPLSVVVVPHPFMVPPLRYDFMSWREGSAVESWAHNQRYKISNLNM